MQTRVSNSVLKYQLALELLVYATGVGQEQKLVTRKYHGVKPLLPLGMRLIFKSGDSLLFQDCCVGEKFFLGEKVIKSKGQP